MILCCRISFLIIVLPVIILLYIFFDFLHTNLDISSKKDFCRLCPHPVSGIRTGISDNTANVDGIRRDQFILCGKAVSTFAFTDTG